MTRCSTVFFSTLTLHIMKRLNRFYLNMVDLPMPGIKGNQSCSWKGHNSALFCWQLIAPVLYFYQMPKQSRIVLPDIPHHITQRGNYRQTVFEEAADYPRYCSWVKEYAKKYDPTILALCLMENHIHFIVVPHTVDSLAKVCADNCEQLHFI